MTDQKRQLAGYVCAILSAVIYGCMPLMANYIYAEGVNPMTLSLLRNLLALPGLAVLALWQKKTLRCDRRTLLSASLPALFGGVLTPVLLFGSYALIPSGTATVLHFANPCMVVLIGLIFLHKKIAPVTLISMIICLVGILLFYDPGCVLDPLGAAMALGSALTFAVYVVLLPRFQTAQFSGFLFCFYFALWSSAILLLLCLVTGQLSLPVSLLGWGLCLVFACAVTTGAVVLFMQGAMLIGGEKTSILSTLEPITGVGLGIVFLHDPARPLLLLGSALVICSGILLAVGDLRTAHK